MAVHCGAFLGYNPLSWNLSGLWSPCWERESLLLCSSLNTACVLPILVDLLFLLMSLVGYVL